MSPFIHNSLSADLVLEILRGNQRRISDAVWAIDSARSMLNKARAGYRNSEATGDGVWDIDTYQRRLEAAILAANNLIDELKLREVPVYIPPHQRLIDQVHIGAGGLEVVIDA